MCGNPRSLRYRVITPPLPPRLDPHSQRPVTGRAVNARTELGRHIFIITSIITKQEDYLLPSKELSKRSYLIVGCRAVMYVVDELL